MMNQIEEIKRALEEVDVTTARGRRTLHGKQINIEPRAEDVCDDAKVRRNAYTVSAKDLRETVEKCHCGITDEELESIELVLEQLEMLARKAEDIVLANY